MPPTSFEQYRRSSSVSFKYAVGDVGIYPKMFHPHYELYLLLRESGVEYTGERRRCRIPPNTLVLIPPGVYHQFLVRGDTAQYERCVLEIEPSFGVLAHFASVTETQAVFSLASGSAVLGCFSRLRTYASDAYRADFPLLAPAVTTEILALLRSETQSVAADAGKLTPLSVQAMEFIHAHLSEPLSLSRIADACFVSPSTLSHAFRKSYGISVMQYIQNKKMVLAKQYIDAGRSPGDVCHLLGYAEYSTFYRAYVREYGASPQNAPLG